MIFKNKDAGKSSIFNDKASKSPEASVDPSVLESFFRKQVSKKSAQSDGTLLNKKVTRSSSTSDANVPADNYFGKSSSRSIFAPDSVPVNNQNGIAEKKSDFLPNIKQEVEQDMADDLARFKGNFSPAAKNAGSHGSIRKDRISIFDEGAFDRIDTPSVSSEKSTPVEEKKISKSLRSTEVVESLWSKIASPQTDKQKSAREKAIDKLFGDKNA